MLRLVSDADFNGHALRGLFRRRPAFDLVRVQDVGLRTAQDPAILEWAAANGRILLTHDRTTMPGFAYERLRFGQDVPGVLVKDDRISPGRIIEELLLLDTCSEHEEWKDQVVYLPL